MSRKKPSKKSFRLRLGKFTPPGRKPIWRDWNLGSIQDIEFGGVKFKAVKDGGVIKAGVRLSRDPDYKFIRNVVWHYSADSDNLAGDINSCAYLRIYPRGETKEGLAVFAWWLENIHLPRASVAYLTKYDGDVAALRKVLNRRGFRLAQVAESRHKGRYPVYLYTHPGDPKLLEKKNKKVVEENVDVLGNTNADVPQPGVVGDQYRSDNEITAIPAAPGPVEAGKELEQLVVDFRYDLSA